MAPSPNPLPPQVGILVFEDDPFSGNALRQILDSEGWRVRVASDTKMLQTELKTGEYSLLIANIAMVGVESALFQVLRELASVSVEDGAILKGGIQVRSAEPKPEKHPTQSQIKPAETTKPSASEPPKALAANSGA